MAKGPNTKTHRNRNSAMKQDSGGNISLGVAAQLGRVSPSKMTGKCEDLGSPLTDISDGDMLGADPKTGEKTRDPSEVPLEFSSGIVKSQPDVVEHPCQKNRARRSGRHVQAPAHPTPQAEDLQAIPAAVSAARDPELPLDPPQKKESRKSKRKASAKSSIIDAPEAVPDNEGKAKRYPSRKRKSAIVETPDIEDAEAGAPKRKRRRRTPEEDREYNITPIAQILPTTFKGRLGYACLNTILRVRKPPVFCSRTCRMSTLDTHGGLEHLHALSLQNLTDLKTMIEWNEQNGIRFFRISSNMFPFASHENLGYDLGFAQELLSEIGELVRKYGHRVTTHPGQYVQLGSPRKHVIEAAVRDLEYHCEMLDRMGVDKDGVMIIHMGGVFGDKPATLGRFKENYAKLSENIKARLVLENDELCYNVDDIFPLCNELNIPIVFDYHHDWIYPSSRPAAELIPEINAIWHRRGIKPKQHYSEPRPGAATVMDKRAHSDRVSKLPDALPDDMDLMLECKDKEQACFYIYRLYNLQEVNQRVLRPPAEVETLRTKGRKSAKRKNKAQEGEDEGADDEEVVDTGEQDDKAVPEPDETNAGDDAPTGDSLDEDTQAPDNEVGKVTDDVLHGKKRFPRRNGKISQKAQKVATRSSKVKRAASIQHM